MNAADGLKARTLIVLSAALLVAFAVRFVLLFQQDQIGPDYAYFYPKLAAYGYWMERNGFFSIPHFLPYMCGGIFDFADPASFYLSFPTIASLALPFERVWPVTAIVFGAVGLLGGYALARRGLGLGPMAALICGTVVLFNGFYSVRMAVGHAAFHGFMLLPWIAAFCVVRNGSGWLTGRVSVACIGLAYAYLLHSGGGAYLLIPSILSTFAIILAASANARDLSIAVARLFAGGIAGALMSLPRIIEVLHLLSYFPRDHYPLPGFSGVLEAFGFLASTLFYWPSLDFVQAHLVNSRYAFELHEAVFGVSVLPLAMVVLFAATRARPWAVGSSVGVLAKCAVLTILFVLPVAVNVYEPRWNEFLKSLPIVGQSFTLIRYYSLYIVPLALLAAFAFDRSMRPGVWKTRIFLAALAVPLGTFLAIDLSQFTRNGYAPASLTAALSETGGAGRRPIVGIFAFRDAEGSIVSRMGRDDLLVQGLSHLVCYQPIFGYKLERFPLGNLRPGRADESMEGAYNFRNPACYVYPSYNQCERELDFRVGQEAALATFLDYGPLIYEEPAYMRSARMLALVVLFLAFYAVISAMVSRGRRPGGGDGGKLQ